MLIWDSGKRMPQDKQSIESNSQIVFTQDSTNRVKPLLINHFFETGTSLTM